MNVFEDGLHHALATRAIGRNLQPLQRGEKLIVDEVEQLVALQGVDIVDVRVGPVAPAELLRNDRLVVVVEQLPLRFRVVINFEKQHPRQLFDALGVTVDARILTHDVADALHEITNTHSSSEIVRFDRSSVGLYKAFSRSRTASR